MKKILIISQNYYPEQFRINDICYELVKKGNDELKEKINKVLERMKNDGTIDQLVLKHSK